MKVQILTTFYSFVLLAEAQWDAQRTIYVEDRESGVQTYWSPELYVELDPETQNYREYRYDLIYGKDYYWRNYDDGVYSEREFEARYNQINYYTDKQDPVRNWGMKMAIGTGIAAGFCAVISLSIILTQCIIRKRELKKKLNAQRELLEMEETSRL